MPRKQYNKNMLKLSLFFTFLLLSRISVLSEDSQTVTLQLKWKHQFQFAGYYAAEKMGFYKEAGLNVIIKEGAPGMDFFDEVVSGRADFSVETPYIMVKREQGLPVVVMAVIFQHSPYILLTEKKAGIFSPSDLKGKTIMMRRESAAEILAMLKAEHVLDQVNIIEHTWNYQDLLDGKVVAAGAYITDRSYLGMSESASFHYLRPINYGIDFYGDCLFTSEQRIHKNPNQVKRFREASLKGWQYAMSHQEEIIDLILKTYNSNTTRENLQYEAKQMEKLLMPEFIEVGHMSPLRWQHIENTFKDLKIIKEDFSNSGLFLQDHLQESFIKKKTFTSVIVASTCLIFLFLMWNYFLRKVVIRKTNELKNSEVRFRDISEVAGDWIWEVDSNGQYLYSSEKLVDVLGYRPEEVVNKKHLFDFFDPSEKDSIKKKIFKIFDSRENIQEMVNKNYHKNGSVVYLETNGKPFYDKSGEFLGYRGIDKDISERIMHEESLNEAKERSEHILDGTHAGTWDWNVQTGELLLNERWVEIIGYSLEELEPISVKTWENSVHPEDMKSIRVILENHLSGKTDHYDVEFRQKHKQGHWVWVNARGKVIDKTHEGQPLRMYGTHLDITDRKLAEMERIELQSQLSQAQKMESIGRLAGGVAHDFNNILSVIIGHTELALLNESISTELKEQLQEIMLASNKSADLVRQLLAFARKQIITPKIINLNDTVEQMLKMIKRLIGEHIELNWKPSPSLSNIYIDPSQIDQIIANVVVNAKDAISQHGTITIQTSDITFSSPYCTEEVSIPPGQYIRLSIEDNGHGMTQETKEKLFEPFFTTKGQHSGTGLGLSTVFGIIKQNNGFIDVISEPGKGSVFHFYFPKYLGEDENNSLNDMSEFLESEGKTILVVEDEPELLETISRIVEKLGFRCLKAGSPGDAINLFSKYADDIHLIMTDIIMPGMNGKLMSDRIKSFSENTEILFMSGYTSDIIGQHGIVEEGVEFIQKPFSMNELKLKLKKILN